MSVHELRPVRPPHSSVDVTQPDPAMKGSERICVAARRDGERCTCRPLLDGLYCASHAGLLDPRRGGKAKAAKIAAEKAEAERLSIEARMGTRAIVASVFAERHADVRKVVGDLLNDALDQELPARDRRAARQAVLPWIHEGFGKPTEKLEVIVPGTLEEVERMSLEELRAARDALTASAS